MFFELCRLYYIFCRILIKNGFYSVFWSVWYTLKSFFTRTKKKKPNFLKLDELQKIYDEYKDRIKPLFEYENLQKYILGSFSDLWQKTLETTEINDRGVVFQRFHRSALRKMKKSGLSQLSSGSSLEAETHLATARSMDIPELYTPVVLGIFG